MNLIDYGRKKWNYHLRADFEVADAALAHGDDVNTIAPGSVQEGSLTVRDTSSTVIQILNQKLNFSGGTAGSDDQNVIGPAISTYVGLAYKVKWEANTTGAYTLDVGFSTGNPYTLVTQRHHYFSLGNDGQIKLRTENGAWGIDGRWYASNTVYEMALVVGGYDSNGVPYKKGDTPANFRRGASFFIKEGAYYNLLYRLPIADAATLSPYVGIPSANSWNHSRVHDIQVPNADLSHLLQPLVLDTFTDTNGTALTAHTPDVDVVGGGWEVDSGTWQIQSNKLVQKTYTIGSYKAVIDVGKSDVFVECSLTTPANSGSDHFAPSIRLRYQDTSNGWFFGMSSITGYRLAEVVESTTTTRVGWTGSMAYGTTYRLTAICKGTNISIFSNDSQIGTTYTSADNFLSATKFGVAEYNEPTVYPDPAFDNFAVYPIGTNGEYSDLDRY